MTFIFVILCAFFKFNLISRGLALPVSLKKFFNATRRHVLIRTYGLYFLVFIIELYYNILEVIGIISINTMMFVIIYCF